MKGRSLRRGFTLVEIMLSVLILGIGLVVVANSYLTALRGMNAASNIVEALNLAKEKYDALEISSLKNGLTASSDSGVLKSPLKNFNYTQEVMEIAGPAELAEYLLQACITLSWQEQNAAKNVIFSTYLLKQKQ
jgi:prepilin-type N-terminal cleavage/methylation domain-containing protein